MHYQILIVSTLNFLRTQCNIPENSSDVFITYEGHVDAYRPRFSTVNVKLTTTDNQETVTENLAPIEATTEAIAGNDDVVFVPNDRQMIRNEDDDDFLEDRVRIDDVMSRRGIGDYVRDGERDGYSGTTEADKEVFFISGKNNENSEKGLKETHIDGKKEISVKRKTTLDCKHLDCNITQSSVCGSKIERNKMKYRLFLNECFFRKVNCAFTNQINRYEQVDIDKCKHIGAFSEKPFRYIPHALLVEKDEDSLLNRRRGFASRRSLSMGMNGRMCSHACPISCPDNYDPVCAISGTGRARVFENHCKLDENSCSYGVVWHMRSLPECVGGKKADMQQNRHFIAWMQKVGIVDNKGKLNLNK